VGLAEGCFDNWGIVFQDFCHCDTCAHEEIRMIDCNYPGDSDRMVFSFRELSSNEF
jgi:hypothetical protein